MTPEAWIAFVGVALTFGVALVSVAYKVGGLNQRVVQREKDADALELRVTAQEVRTGEINVAMAAMRVLLENINVAVSGRKVNP